MKNKEKVRRISSQNYLGKIFPNDFRKRKQKKKRKCNENTGNSPFGQTTGNVSGEGPCFKTLDWMTRE